MRIIITCAGSQEKWGNYLGVPSHFAPLRRPAVEPLLHRTVRQALEYTKDVHITAPDDERYVFPGVKTHVGLEGDSEYTNTRKLWINDGRTVLLLGDVFFTRDAMISIMTYKGRAYRVFGRSRGSRITGCTWGEIFAVSWWPSDFDMLDHHLEVAAHARAHGNSRVRIRPWGWLLLRSVQGTPLGEHRVSTNWFTEINDWTDDIDFPKDYDRHPATRKERHPEYRGRRR